MKANVVDLRYRMKEVLKALERNETVTVLYRGKVKGILQSVLEARDEAKVEKPPFFGSAKADKSVQAEVDALRKSRT